MKKIIILTLAGLALAGLALAESRTWTQAATGKTIDGELTGVTGDKATIVSKGKAIQIPIAMLADADKTFIEEFQKAKAGTPDPAGDTPSADDLKIPEGPTELVLTEAHSCCKTCYEAIEGALGSFIAAEVSAKKGEITITAKTGQDVKTALGYVMEKGFYGQPSIAAFADEKKYKTDEVKELYLTRVHVCCGSCERDLKAALKTVEGIEDHTDIEKGVGEFHLEGTFTEAQVMAALHAAGMHGSLSPNSRN